MKKNKKWIIPTAFFMALLITGMLFAPATQIVPVVAQINPEPLPPTLGGCIENDCGNVNCKAGDVQVTIFETYDVLEPCTHVGDTGTYVFLAKFDSTAGQRYDPTVWLAADGGDAYTGSCYRDYLNPITTDASSIDLNSGYGFFWDLEPGGTPVDSCGDINSADGINYKFIGPVTITCNQETLDTQSIATIVAWDNQPAYNCPANLGCPLPTSKCNGTRTPIEISIWPVDLEVEKTTTASDIFPGDTFVYNLVVNNLWYSDYIPGLPETTENWVDFYHKSTGYRITDNLPIWLKPVSLYNNATLGISCVAEADPSEFCYNTGCNGYGDIVKCTFLPDLPDDSATGPVTNDFETAVTNSGPAIELGVQFWSPPSVDYCEGNSVDPRCTATPTDLSHVTNIACVEGNEVDPYSGNNCSEATVYTEIDLMSFTATGFKKEIVLEWQTASETDNAGFNLYRSTSINGPRIKLNDTLIPSAVYPGSPYGASYSYTDTYRLKRNTTYYYWLEDVDIYNQSTLHGPVTSQIVPRTPFLWFNRN